MTDNNFSIEVLPFENRYIYLSPYSILSRCIEDMKENNTKEDYEYNEKVIKEFDYEASQTTKPKNIVHDFDYNSFMKCSGNGNYAYIPPATDLQNIQSKPHPPISFMQKVNNIITSKTTYDSIITNLECLKIKYGEKVNLDIKNDIPIQEAIKDCLCKFSITDKHHYIKTNKFSLDFNLKYRNNKNGSITVLFYVMYHNKSGAPIEGYSKNPSLCPIMLCKMSSY